jgi:hypothetical protein
VKLPGGLRRTKRRREPRFWVEARAEHSAGGQLAQIVVSIRNDSDVPHRVDEALIRYDDGRVGYQLAIEAQLVGDIPPHQAVVFRVPAAELLDLGTATRFRVVTFRGRHGRRQEWSSKEERFTAT